MYPLSIAGFDPCGGAGVLADCKVFEAHEHIGFGVTTSITYQNEKIGLVINTINPPESVDDIEKAYTSYIMGQSLIDYI